VFLCFVVLGCLIIESSGQQYSCVLCKKLITAVSDEVRGNVSESGVTSTVTNICNALRLADWCKTNVYEYLYDIFIAMRSNETPSIVCERLNICHYKILSITGDILFAERDKLDQVVVTNAAVKLNQWTTIDHPEISSMNITGLSCGTVYCTLLLKGFDTIGYPKYSVSAITTYSQKHQTLRSGSWYGPWYDIHTNQFWMGVVDYRNLTFGIYDAQYNTWIPKISVHIRAREVLSGMILNRILYYTLKSDPHVYMLDLALHYSQGNFTTPYNTMLVGNPVTNELYGYTNGPEGIFRYDAATKFKTHTQIVRIDLSAAYAIPSSTIDPVNNVMWVSLWGIAQEAWLKVDLKTSPPVVQWASVRNREGYFDFNPWSIKCEEE